MTRARRLATLARSWRSWPARAAERPPRRPARLLRRRRRAPPQRARRPARRRGGRPRQHRHDAGHHHRLGLLRRIDAREARPGRLREGIPWITVDYQALDWTDDEKFTVASRRRGAGCGDAHMTWIPTCRNGALEDLSTISGGQLNGTPIADHYKRRARSDAMTFDGKFVTMLFDSIPTRSTTARISSPRRDRGADHLG